ncbi:MAG: hypothetical protein GY749_31700 [Desulfobacteraceae bacterium]|nr:hypothetical protein [Desulfobacteraceae bacterium]
MFIPGLIEKLLSVVIKRLHPFYTDLANESALSAAPPNAFGFLDNTVTGISFEGPGELTEEEGTNYSGGLHVPEGETISLIGGDIEIRRGAFYIDENSKFNEVSDISTPGGRINLAGAASAGEVIFTDQGLDVSSFESMGDITISDKAVVDVSGGESGRLYIRSENFVADEKSSVNAKALGDKNGGLIDIQVGALSFSNDSSITHRSISFGIT